MRELETNCLIKNEGFGGLWWFQCSMWSGEMKEIKAEKKVAMSVYLKCLESGEERRGEKPLAA